MPEMKVLLVGLKIILLASDFGICLLNTQSIIILTIFLNFIISNMEKGNEFTGFLKDKNIA